MPPEAPLLLEKPLLQILSNIVAGVHPPNPAGPSSVLEHFTRTRYSDVIRPEILKEWNGQDHISSSALDVKGTASVSEPSRVFCDKVSRRLFEALSSQELAQVTKDYEEEWIAAKKRYEQAIRTMYGQPDIERVMCDMPDILGMILTALETLTNNHLILWAGGAGKQGFGLVNIASDCSKNEKPAYIPETQKIFFEQMARQVMSVQQEAFLSKCSATSALLPSTLFHETPPKSEFIEGTSLVATKSEATNIQKLSLLSPIMLDHPLLSPHSGDEQRTSALPARFPAENIKASVSSIAGASGTNGGEEKQNLLTLKRKRTSETPSPQHLTPAKKPRFTPVPSPSEQIPLPPRSPRKASDRFLSIGWGSPSTVMSPTPGTPQIVPLMTKTAPGTSPQVSRRRSAMPPPGLLTRFKTRDISLPPIRYLGEPQATHNRIIVPRLPLSAPPAFPSVRLKTKDDHPSIPATCPAQLQALINTIPESASWLPRALASILGVDVGPKYHRLVSLLIELETLHKFTNRRKHLSSTSRPAVLKKWIYAGRKRPERSYKVGDMGAYAQEWWKWWQILQPKWRVFDSDTTGVCVGTSAVHPESPDAWNCLLVPGANGLLGVVASLYWWGCGVVGLKGKQRKEEEDGWAKAVEDCAWVMECLVEVMKLRKASNIGGTSDTAQDADADGEEDEKEDHDEEGEEEDELQE